MSSKPVAFLGIDPGFTGALAVVLDAAGTYDRTVDAPVHDVRFVKRGKKRTRKEFTVSAMVDTVAALVAAYDVRLAALESVSARPDQGTTSMFRFGHGLGLWEGVLTALGVPHVMPTATEWKQACGLLRTEKDAARLAAMTRWPAAAADLKFKKHQGRADALWLADYARRVAQEPHRDAVQTPDGPRERPRRAKA